MITGWRPYKSINPKVKNNDDKVISMWKCLDREGEPGYINNYNWNGAKQQIKGIYQGSVKQEDAINPNKK